MQKASYILILIDRMPAQGPEWLKSTVLDKLSPEKGGRPYRDCTDSKTRIEAVEVGPQDFGSWAYVTMAASTLFMMKWNHEPDLDKLRWQQFTGRIGNGAVVQFLSEGEEKAVAKPRAKTRKPKPEPDVADGRTGEQLTRQEPVEKVDYQHIRRLLSRAPGSGGVDLVDMGGLEQTIIFDLEGGYTPTAEEVKLARQVRAFEVEGNQCMHSGRFEEAITYFEKAAQISRADGILYQNISVAYNRLGNLPKAREAIREALRREPDNARIQNNARAIGVSSYGSSEASLAQPAAPMAAPAIATDQKPRGKTNALAIASLVLGIVALLTSSGGIGAFLGVAAFITGIIGGRQIRESDGAQKGAGAASAGMILGGVSVLLGILSILAFLLLVMILANQSG